MIAEIADQMINFSSYKGDRIDPVAQVCRSLFLRGELCPCRYPQNADRFPNHCVQCQNEHALIEAAWGVPLERTTKP